MTTISLFSGKRSIVTVSSTPNEDQFQQTNQSGQDQDEPQAAVEKPADPQGFWQQPTEPLEKEFREATSK